MTRFTLSILTAVLAVPSLIAAPVPVENAKGAVFPYSAKAHAVVCLNGYDKAHDRLNAMLKAAFPDDAAKLTKELDTQLNKFLEGRKLTSLTKGARLFMVLSDLTALFENGDPFSVLLPVTSYKDFRESFLTKDELKSFDKGRDGVDSIKSSAIGEETTVYLIDLKEYVAITPDKGVADSYAAKYTPGSTEPMGPEAADSFLKADIALYVNMDAINEQFGDKIRGFRGLIDFGLQQAQQQGAIQGLNKKQLEAMKIGLKAIFQGVEDCRSIVLAAEFKPEGISARLHARFAENTPSVKLIKSEESTLLKELGKLPKGLNIYTEHRLVGQLGKFFNDMNKAFSTTEDDDKGTEIIEQQMKNLAEAGLNSQWSGAIIPNTSITVSNFKDPAKAVQANLKAYKAVAPGGQVSAVAVKTAPKVAEDAETHRGFKFAEIRLHFDFEATVAALPDGVRDAALESLKKSQSEKSSIWLGTDGKTVIQLSAKDWATAKTTLDKYLDAKETVSSDRAFQLTREQLPADATLVLIAETGSTISSIMDSAKGLGQALPGFPQIGEVKAPKGDPTYVGLAIAMKGETIGISGFIPTKAMGVARQMLDGLFKNIE
jgi:hypothetical protein